MKKLNKEKGITLIALVITIIVLLILAGIVLSLTLGKNGVIQKAKESGTAYQEQEAREKLELVLLDLQADKKVDTTYDENETINTKIEQNEMTINDDIVFVDGWQFQIDRSVPQIIANLGKGEISKISTPYIGTTSFTIKLEHVVNEEEVKSYTYVLDGNEIATDDKKEYTIEDLEAETVHIAKVVVNYKNGNSLESNVIKLQLEPKTYLYNNGENSDFWANTFTIDNFNKGKLTYVEPVKNKNDIVLDLIDSGKYEYTAINTKEKINLSNYQSLKIDYEVLSECYMISFGIADDLYITDITDYYDTSGNDRLEQAKGEHVGNRAMPGKYLVDIDTSDIDKDKYIYCYSAVGVAADVRGKLKINSIWLEK